MHNWNDRKLGADPFVHDPLKVLIKGYLQVDKFGLFYQQLPPKAFYLIGERCAGV